MKGEACIRKVGGRLEGFPNAAPEEFETFGSIGSKCPDPVLHAQRVVERHPKADDQQEYWRNDEDSSPVPRGFEIDKHHRGKHENDPHHGGHLSPVGVLSAGQP